ncbi:Hypothetical protein, putative [Bodo saltans]|uniref:Uncharacterized protein n=1 Tax=Bodo saltans TaxID=75058 RepID=A0A0S4JBH8_BODSA|nr:Hypothetical protein, putative [Bodo saltans]|eukprot:CUG86247.1 Hypothetical protein, putative [Bodo saltans]
MFRLIAKDRDSPDKVLHLDSLVATQNTTLFDVREAIAKKLAVAPAAVAVFANSVKVANYQSALGIDFSKDGWISYERRVSKQNAPSTFQAAVAVVASNFVSCRCGMQFTPHSNTFLPLNCGCLVCHACAATATYEYGGGDHNDNSSETICPFHVAPTPNNVVLLTREIGAASDDSEALVGDTQQRPFTYSRHTGPYNSLLALVETQQCQRQTMGVDGVTTKCNNTTTFRSNCKEPPMCRSCCDAHRAEARHHVIRDTPLSVQECLYVCKNPDDSCAPLKYFSTQSKSLLCGDCISVNDFSHAVSIFDKAHLDHSADAAAKIWSGLTATLRRCDGASATALEQYELLAANERDNLSAIRENCNLFVKGVTTQFADAIEQLRSMIAEMESDRQRIVKAAHDVTKKFETEFSRKVHKQRNNLKAYIATAESLSSGAREHLVALLHTARFAPAIIPAANALIDFAQNFTASSPTSMTVRRFVACTMPFKPLVRINVSTSNNRCQPKVTYVSQANDIIRQLYQRKILQNKAQKAFTLVGLSQPEIAFTNEVQATRKAAREFRWLNRRSLYHRLFEQPSVSLAEAYGSTVTEVTSSDDMLRRGLSNLVGGPPLPLVRSRALTQEHAKEFIATATAVLNRVKDADSDDYLHFRELPLTYKLLAAVLRQASRPEHVVALLMALSAPTATPHLLLGENCWRRYDKVILSDVDLIPNPQVLSRLQAEMSGIVFDDHRRDSDDALEASRSFLWNDRDEFVATVLHVMLLSQLGAEEAVALPPLSESSWLPRFTKLVAVALGSGWDDVATVTRCAVNVVSANPLAAFATFRLARALSIALTMETAECVHCGLVVPRDYIVRCGVRILCKLCFETASLCFAVARSLTDRALINDYKLALQHFNTIVSDDVVGTLSRSIAAAEEAIAFNALFHCPLNDLHDENPFHAPKPEHPQTPGAPVGITCPECNIRWCAKCSRAEHPHAATCGEVTNTRIQWSVYSDNMTRSANEVLDEFDSEAAAMNLRMTDRAARLRPLLHTQIARTNRNIDDIDTTIRQIHESNHAEMTWDGYRGSPKVIGSRRCPHCGRQPIRLVGRCRLVVCGQNTHDGGNYQGGCLHTFYYDSPEAAYQPISTASEEAEKAKLQSDIRQLTVLLEGVDNQTNFPPPVLPSHWPSLRCSSCGGGLLGDFHVQCYHCVPPYLLCVYCVRDNKHNEHADPRRESGHVLTLRRKT